VMSSSSFAGSSRASSSCNFPSNGSSFGFTLSERSSSSYGSRVGATMPPSVLPAGAPPGELPPVPNVPRANGSLMGREFAASRSHSAVASLATSTRSSLADFSDVTPEEHRQQQLDGSIYDSPAPGTPKQFGSAQDLAHQRSAHNAQSSTAMKHYLFQPPEVRNSNRSTPQDEPVRSPLPFTPATAAAAAASANVDPAVHYDGAEEPHETLQLSSPPSQNSLVELGVADMNQLRNGGKIGGGVSGNGRSGGAKNGACEAAGKVDGSTRKAPRRAMGRSTLAWKCSAQASSVAVAGSWLKWKREVMQRVDRTKWCAELELPVGVYEYKYVVDEREWVVDSEAERRADASGIVNNVLRVGLFEARFVWDKTQAREVYLAGSFDNWATRRRMERVVVDSGDAGQRPAMRFELALPLPIGRYEYKFIVDGKWYFDVTLPSSGSHGAYNNVLALGSAAREFVWDKTDAAQVFLVGSFDGWKRQIPMHREESGRWVLTHELPPGHYEYKYVVDGNWWFDTSCLSTGDPYGNRNNVVEHCV